MAENKKSFVLYSDLIKTFEYLTDEQRGQVIWWVLQYVNDLNPEPLPGLLAAVTEPIKQQLKRDLYKYEQRANNSRKNGSLGGRPKKPKETQKNPVGFSGNPDEPKKPDSDIVTVTDTVTVSDNVIKNKKSKDVFIDLCPFFYDDDFQNSWKDYVAVRKKKKASSSERAIKTIIKKLIEHSFGNKETAIQIIDQSSLNGWSDIYPLKNKTQINSHAKQDRTETNKRDSEERSRRLAEELYNEMHNNSNEGN